MSNSKPLLLFTYDVLRYLNRDQLERFSVVCRPLKNLIERYFHSKPYRIFYGLCIREGMYALALNGVYWHPNRDDYSVQQFMAGQRYNGQNFNTSYIYYSFAKMRPYLGPTVRIKQTYIYVSENITYNSEHNREMESITYLWRGGGIDIRHSRYGSQIVAKDFQLILNSMTILQCRELSMYNAHFTFKDYKVLYSANSIKILYYDKEKCSNSWSQFLEQPGIKPVIVFGGLRREDVDNLFDCLFKGFSSAVSPNAFKIVFDHSFQSLPEFRKTNKVSGEKLELKKGLPIEYRKENLKECNNYTLERSSI